MNFKDSDNQYGRPHSSDSWVFLNFRCVSQVTLPYSAKFILSGNGKESSNSIIDQVADPDHHQNLITAKLGQV